MSKHWTCWKNLPKTKHSSLLQIFINYNSKKVF
jgi:hypothetical protein